MRVVTDEEGLVQTIMDYLPFGKLMPNTYGNADIISYRYTGQEFDEELGLYNYRARIYNPMLGRFYSVDPRFQYGIQGSLGSGPEGGSHIDFLICSISVSNHLLIFTTDRDFQNYSQYLPIHLFEY